jgi:hypothetical protein
MIRDLLARLRTIDEGNLMAWARKVLGELYVRYCGELAPLICEGFERSKFLEADADDFQGCG